MKKLKVGICLLDEEDKLLTYRSLKANWTVNIEQDLLEEYGELLLVEISEILTESTKLELKSRIIMEMLEQIQDRIF